MRSQALMAVLLAMNVAVVWSEKIVVAGGSVVRRIVSVW